jgi:hypothetical protein
MEPKAAGCTAWLLFKALLLHRLACMLLWLGWCQPAVAATNPVPHTTPCITRRESDYYPNITGKSLTVKLGLSGTHDIVEACVGDERQQHCVE